jgi:hypothetical protein
MAVKRLSEGDLFSDRFHLIDLEGLNTNFPLGTAKNFFWEPLLGGSDSGPGRFRQRSLPQMDLRCVSNWLKCLYAPKATGSAYDSGI